MASSFLLCYPDVPVNALVISSNQTYDGDYPLVNTFTGRRGAYAQLPILASSVEITYDLGTGNSRTVDHFILGGTKGLYAGGVTQATLQGSNDGSTWTDQLGTAADFQTRTFDGPDGQDLIFTGTYNTYYLGTLLPFRYWKVILAGGSHTFPVSKIYFGQSLDMGEEPAVSTMEVTTEGDGDTWRYQRGNILMTRAFYPRLRFTVEWDGVTDAKAAEFAQKVLNNPYKDGVYLYAGLYADPLYDNKLVFCRVVADECSLSQQQADYWNIKLVCEEDI